MPYPKRYSREEAQRRLASIFKGKDAPKTSGLTPRTREIVAGAKRQDAIEEASKRFGERDVYRFMDEPPRRLKGLTIQPSKREKRRKDRSALARMA